MSQLQNKVDWAYQKVVSAHEDDLRHTISTICQQLLLDGYNSATNRELPDLYHGDTSPYVEALRESIASLQDLAGLDEDVASFAVGIVYGTAMKYKAFPT